MTEPFKTLVSRVVRLHSSNIDTDQIVPARFMRTPRSEGYANFLFHDVRLLENDQPDPSFPLNAPASQGAKIIVAGSNFGCGSSREAAVYALFDFGIRCVIAPSFSDIFQANCCKNGVLPVALPQAELDQLMDGFIEDETIEVNLSKQVVKRGDREALFDIEAFWKEGLLTGLDEIDLTLRRRGEIAQFYEQHIATQPWLVFDLDPSSSGASSG
jgi:3-isopropylmalate/(R)-2-methylmalate dehydratase small subunit